MATLPQVLILCIIAILGLSAVFRLRLPLLVDSLWRWRDSNPRPNQLLKIIFYRLLLFLKAGAAMVQQRSTTVILKMPETYCTVSVAKSDYAASATPVLCILLPYTTVIPLNLPFMGRLTV